MLLAKLTSRPVLLAALAIGIYCLSGCAQSRREGQTVRRWSEQGEQGGVPFSKTGEETSQVSETTKTGVDPQALAGVVTTAVRAAMAAGSGGFSLGLPEAAGAAATLIAGGAAFLQSRKAARKSAEADSAWDAERDASIKAALLTPPPKETNA